MNATASATSLPRSTLLLLATIAGVAVANIYYNQPLLDDFRHSFPNEAHWVGLVPTATQLGYAFGMLFLAPLGDRYSRRSLIIILLLASAAALAAAAAAPTLWALIAASLVVGIVATAAQQAIPFAAELAPVEKRGAAVGMAMSGLLLGILLARTVAGTVAEHAGWRWVYGAAVVVMLVLAAVSIRLPHRLPSVGLSYRQLLGSLAALFRREPALRQAALTGASLFAAFSAFWSVLTLLLAEAPFHMGSQTAGLFGLVGAAGALAAPLAGKSADRRGPLAVVKLGIVLCAISFVIFGLSARSIVGLLLGVIVLDIGVQAAQISNQSLIYALDPGARSRLNTVYMVCYFIGGSLGSALGSLAWRHAGWTGVCIVGLAASAVAGSSLLGFLRGQRGRALSSKDPS
ncbi:MAG: MFS transporter [Janthinobacterium lividum]